MKKSVWVLLGIGMPLAAGSYCWKIKNSDQKALCEAKYEHKKSCWKIRDSDLKAYCEATAEWKRSCWKIRENDLKAMCEAEVAAR